MRNPYEVLQLPAQATTEQIMAAAARLAQSGDDEAREAVRQLTASEEERQLHAWLTPPGAVERPVEVERFVAQHRRPPAGLHLQVPPVDEAELRERLRSILLSELKPGPVPLQAVPIEESAEEVARQNAEAVWLSLLFDLRG
jgi:plasmid stability protein